MIGYDDQGQAFGIEKADKLLEDITNKVRDILGIVIDVNLVMHDSLETLHIEVPAYPYPISYKVSITTAVVLPSKNLKVLRWIAFCFASKEYTGMLCPCLDLKKAA